MVPCLAYADDGYTGSGGGSIDGDGYTGSGGGDDTEPPVVTPTSSIYDLMDYGEWAVEQVLNRLSGGDGYTGSGGGSFGDYTEPQDNPSGNTGTGDGTGNTSNGVPYTQDGDWYVLQGQMYGTAWNSSQILNDGQLNVTFKLTERVYTFLNTAVQICGSVMIFASVNVARFPYILISDGDMSLSFEQLTTTKRVTINGVAKDVPQYKAIITTNGTYIRLYGINATRTWVDDGHVEYPITDYPNNFTSYETTFTVDTLYEAEYYTYNSGGGGYNGNGSAGESGDSNGNTYVYSPNTYNNNYNTYPTNTNYNNTYNTTTTYNNLDLDLSPITQRIDALNAMVGNLGLDIQSIGNDIRVMISAILNVDASITRFGNWLAGWLGAICDNQVLSLGMLRGLWDRLGDIETAISDLDVGGDTVDMTDTNTLLNQIKNDLQNLDRDTDDISLTTIETYLRTIRDNTEPRTIDFTQFFNAFRAMQASLDGILADFDNLMLIMEDWPDYPSASNIDLSALEDLADDVSEWHNDFVTWWDGWRSLVTDINEGFAEVIGLLEDMLPKGKVKHVIPDTPGPTDIIGPLDVDDDGYPVMPDWDFWSERPEIDALRDAVDELMTKFPFCTISDLVTLMAYLVRPAVTPVFDLPAPNPSDWGNPYMVHVDLSQFETAAAVLRMGMVLLVGVRLTRRSIRMWTHDEFTGDDA